MGAYIKPNISFQTLSLSTTVSTGCAIQGTNEPQACPVELPDYPGLVIYNTDGTCMYYFPGYDDSLCYHVPIVDMNIFDS